MNVKQITHSEFWSYLQLIYLCWNVSWITCNFLCVMKIRFSCRNLPETLVAFLNSQSKPKPETKVTRVNLNLNLKSFRFRFTLVTWKWAFWKTKSMHKWALHFVKCLPFMEANFQPVMCPPTMLIDAGPYETMKESSIFFPKKIPSWRRPFFLYPPNQKLFS